MSGLGASVRRCQAIGWLVSVGTGCLSVTVVVRGCTLVEVSTARVGVWGMASTEVRHGADPQTGGPPRLPGSAAGPEPAVPLPPSQVDADYGVPGRRRQGPEAGVEEIRRRYGSDTVLLFPRLETWIGRRLGLAPLAGGAAVLAGLIGVAIRLAAALLVTALAGQWSGIPWGRWAVLLAFFGLFDAWRTQICPPVDVEPRPDVRRIVAGWAALLPTVARESDVADLAAFTRRWMRLTVAAATGVAVTAIVLLACWQVAPTGMADLHPGSLVLLAFMLYEFGTLVFGQLFWWALIRRESGYDHHLFGLSPADSPEVRTARQKMPGQSFEFGGTFTLMLVLAWVLTSWDSPLVLPLGVGFLVIGYLTTIGSALGDRAAIRRIVERVRDQQLDGLQQQIEPYWSRYPQLTPQEGEQLRGLAELHTVIRDTPTTATPRSLWRAVAGLILPTVVFALTVLAEVSAERFLDTILP